MDRRPFSGLILGNPRDSHVATLRRNTSAPTPERSAASASVAHICGQPRADRDAEMAARGLVMSHP